MKNFLIHTLRIISGVILSIGTFFLAGFLMSILFNQGMILKSVLFYLPVILLLFVLPLLVILLLHTTNERQKEQNQMVDKMPNVSEVRLSFLRRPINSL